MDKREKEIRQAFKNTNGITEHEFSDEIVSLLVRHLLPCDDHANVRRLLENARKGPVFVTVGGRIAVGLPVHRDMVRHSEFV